MTSKRYKSEEECKQSKLERTRKWREDNHERSLELSRKYYQQNREKYKEKSRQYRLQNRDKVKESQQRYRDKNRDKRNKYNRDYYHSNRDSIQWNRMKFRLLFPDKYRAQNIARGALKRANRYKCIIGDLEEIKQFYEDVISSESIECYYCKERCGKSLLLRPAIDHKVPLSKGGQHDISNLVACCEECNARKTNKTVEEFDEYLELLAQVKSEIKMERELDKQDK